MDIELSDAKIVRRIGSGNDREAEAELFLRMAPRIRLYGLRHLRDERAAEDLVQQVLIIALEALKAGRLRESDKLVSFVLRTCRMTVLGLRRNTQRQELLPEHFGRDPHAPMQPFTLPLDYEQLARCVQNLKERERSVVVMSFYDGRSGADVASLLGISEANVRVIRHRAIRQLHDWLKGGRMSCANPIDSGIIADYWLAILPQPEEEAVEEHLFACDECGVRLRKVIALAEGVRKIAREGFLRMVVSDSFLQRAAEEGLRIRQCDVPAGGGTQCTVTAEDDLLIAHLTVNLTGANRVDLCICDERGVEQFRLSDIPIHPGTSNVVYQESITFAKALPTSKLVARLVTFDEAGGEHQLGEYTFNYTRSLSGPGVW